MPFSIYVLAAGIFVINMGETVIMGLLNTMARDLDVSIASAGFLVSAYAAGVVLGAPLLTPFLVTLPRKQVLTALMMVFVVGNVACALAPGYEMLFAARIVTALAQASFLGLGAVVAMELVAPARRAAAVSAVFFGSTMAIMLGAPIGTALGQSYGWRTTFLVLAVAAALTAVTTAAWLPRFQASAAPDLRQEFRTLLRPEMLEALLITALGFGGTFTTYTYIAPMLTEVAGVAPGWVPAILLLLGFGMFLGNPVGGRLADWNLPFAVRATLLSLATILAVMALVTTNTLLFCRRDLRLRHVAVLDDRAAADGGDGTGRRRPDVVVGVQHRSLQPRQRAWRVDRRRGAGAWRRLAAAAVDRRCHLPVRRFADLASATLQAPTLQATAPLQAPGPHPVDGTMRRR